MRVCCCCDRRKAKSDYGSNQWSKGPGNGKCKSCSGQSGGGGGGGHGPPAAACFNCGKTGHKQANCRARGGGGFVEAPSKAPKQAPKCHNCGNTGHIKRDCRKEGGGAHDSNYVRLPASRFERVRYDDDDRRINRFERQAERGIPARVPRRWNVRPGDIVSAHFNASHGGRSANTRRATVMERASSTDYSVKLRFESKPDRDGDIDPDDDSTHTVPTEYVSVIHVSDLEVGDRVVAYSHKSGFKSSSTRNASVIGEMYTSGEHKGKIRVIFSSSATEQRIPVHWIVDYR